jgi:hypothetical protein
MKSPSNARPYRVGSYINNSDCSVWRHAVRINTAVSDYLSVPTILRGNTAPSAPAPTVSPNVQIVPQERGNDKKQALALIHHALGTIKNKASHGDLRK